MTTVLGRFRNFSNWAELIIGRFFFRRTTLQVHRVGDKQMIVDHRCADAGSIRGCVSDPMYADLLDRVTVANRIRVLDLGANVGGFPFLLHARGHQIDDLTCIELNPNTFIRLMFNVKINWPKASVLNNAITSKAGDLTVTLGQGDTGDSLRGSPDGGGEAVTVQARRLDDLPDKGVIDILKMDIEHGEVDVLLNPGHEKTLARCKVLVIEIHPLERAKEIHDAITATGLRHVAGPDNLVGQHIFERAADD